jgi:hypothetical protein
VPSLSSFGEDAAGRVYVASLNGAVYRLAGSGRPSSPPGESPPPAPGTANAEAGAPSASPVVAGATLRLGLDAGRRVVRASTGRVRLVVTCSQACPFGVRAAVFGARATRLTRGLPAGRSVVVLRLSRAARAALRRSLRRGRRPTVGLHVSAGGVARTVRLRVVG